MGDNVNAFLDRLRESPDLKAEVIAAPSIEAVVAIASAEGIDLDLESVLKLRSAYVIELSDSDLESVSGGDWFTK